MSQININDQIRDANLLKKYHKSLIHDYTEYPTKNKWIDTFKSEEYKNSLKDWLGRNPDKPIMFYIHTPFCEQLCWFCLCSKEITQDYSKVKKLINKHLEKKAIHLSKLWESPTLNNTYVTALNKKKGLIVSTHKDYVYLAQKHQFYIVEDKYKTFTDNAWKKCPCITPDC